MSPPASYGRTAIPQGSSVLRGSGSLRWGHPFGSSLSAFVTWSDRTFFPLWGWGTFGFLSCAGFRAFARRSPLWVDSACLCVYSIGTKVLTWFFLCFLFLRLLTGCYALALLDSCHTTVDCLLLASSAVMLRVHGKLTYKSFGFTPSICLATGTVNLYTVINPPVCSDECWVPCGSLVLWSSGPSRWVNPLGSSLRTYSIGSKAHLWTSASRSFAMGHLWVEFLCYGTLLIVSKDFLVLWGPSSFRMGSPF